MEKTKYKTIEKENGTINIYGNNEEIELYYDVPDWSDEESPCFEYRENKYFLDEFMRIDKYSSEWMQEFHGHLSDTYFSGILVKLTDDADKVKVYDYCC